MFGNYPVNDDWVFVRQIEAFEHGIIKLSAELDPSFLAQGGLGYIWSRFFSANFVSLQLLTMLMTLLGLWGLVKVLRLFKLRKSLIIVSCMLYIFNPLIFTSAFSFMTDNYLLTFMVWSLYFFLRYQQNDLYRDVLLGSVLMLLAALTRQVGVFAGAAFLLRHWLGRSKKLELKVILTVLTALVLGILIPLLWPAYGSNRLLLLVEQIPERARLWLLSWHYYPLFIFPLLLGLKVKVDKAVDKVMFLVLAAIFTVFLYHFDIFPLGNVLYIEDLYTKSDFRSNFSLFDNIFFKLGLSVLVSLAMARLAMFFVQVIRSKKLSWESGDMFLLLLGLMNCGVLLISSDLYDRYLLPGVAVFWLLLMKKFSDQIEVNKKVILTTALMIFVSVALQWEFSTKNRVKWQQVRELSRATGYVTQIELNDTYIDHIVTQQKNDFTGLIERKGSYDKVCFVQEYTLDGDGVWLQKAQDLEDLIDKRLIEKKKPYQVSKKNISRAKNNLGRLMYNERYFSFLYDLVGKQAYVGSWCVEE